MAVIDQTTIDMLIRNQAPAPSAESTVQQRREELDAATDRMFEDGGQEGPAVDSVSEHVVPVNGGEISVRIYSPNKPKLRGCYIYMHGGAFWVGSASRSDADAHCRERCVGANIVVVSVNYRLAPEHKFPIPVEDCYAALRWVYNNHERLGIDQANISIGGYSAGGTLAAAVALKARLDGAPVLRLQLIEAGPLDLTGCNWTSVDMERAGLSSSIGALNPESLALGDPLVIRTYLLNNYLHETDDPADQFVSPMRAANLTGVAPAYIMVPEFDPMAPDGPIYAKRLNDAGVPATVSLLHDHLHITPNFTKVFEPARTWQAEVITQLRKAHATN